MLTKNENEEFCTITMYNLNLEIVGQFGQGDRLLPFFFSIKSYDLMVNVVFLSSLNMTMTMKIWMMTTVIILIE